MVGGNAALLGAAARMHLEHRALCARSQARKATWCAIPLIGPVKTDDPRAGGRGMSTRFL